nr:hypothetical protein [Kibdelosporangium sp. MJ126-NF4]CEL22181.1 hypothetical protein [Kibdelosporangium sp. MJ126-NF4]CTQ92962.1 hypothetical protein [Kibdelosporangium sp. MJ126-NF4]
MRKNILLGAVGVGIAGLFIAGPVALAEQSQGNDAKIAVDKAAYLPGEAVKLNGVCRMEGVGKWTVTSKAFESAAEIRVVGRNTDDFAGTAKIGKHVRPGTYSISFACAGDKINTRLTIKGKPVTLQPTATKEQVAVKPKGAANTGEGDVDTAAPVQEQGSNTGLFVLGGSGLLAAGGVGAFMLRRRSRTQS